ncbi:Pal1 cell morphology protein [Rutstroemia sp. NJR-2017a BBW]|nr:Pal1 cell morphology protein [Rutstroemia sp. NJR-2017a BBW]
MSLSSIQPHEGNRSPSLSINLSSNNPFRNRAASPAMSSSTQRSPQDPPPRPTSRNPFLDSSTTTMAASSVNTAFPRTSPTASGPALTGNAAELFDELTLVDKPVPNRSNKPPPPPRSITDRGQPPAYGSMRENVRPGGHRINRSRDEEALRAKKARQNLELDIFADPNESPKTRVRRNSDTSIVGGKLLDPEDERRRLEREKRNRRREKDRKPKNPLDIIDQLDATSIFGTGAFHHDGPFDACNPSRNRKGSRRAPMQAFDKDSTNMTLGGGGPLNAKPDHALFMGNGDIDAFTEFSRDGIERRPGLPSRTESNIESAYTRVEPVHGEESIGLGTSTFLEGAPASRTAIQQNQSSAMEGGLSRKKSLAQKIRGINSRRDYGPSGRVTSPDGSFPSPETYTPGGSRVNDANPFFNEFSKGDDTIKEESLTSVESQRPQHTRAPSSPPGIERRVTSDGNGGGASGGGFLSRVKSLKGGPRKPRVENKPLPTPQLL